MNVEEDKEIGKINNFSRFLIFKEKLNFLIIAIKYPIFNRRNELAKKYA